ncbi:hypothetical protein [Glycomyces halotolerans]
MGSTLYGTEQREVNRWAMAEARLAGLIKKERNNKDRGESFATFQLNDFFGTECRGLPLPWEWRWTYGCPRGQFTTMVRSSVTAWAEEIGDGTVEAEPAGGGEVMVQADCLKFGQRFTVWGYVHQTEVDEIGKLVWGRSM